MGSGMAATELPVVSPSPIRHTDPATGFTHHGFLNILLAVEALVSGAPRAAAVEWLAETDVATVVRTGRARLVTAATHTRKFFTSFGTCSVLEPIDADVAKETVSIAKLDQKHAQPSAACRRVLNARQGHRHLRCRR